MVQVSKVAKKVLPPNQNHTANCAHMWSANKSNMYRWWQQDMGPLGHNVPQGSPIACLQTTRENKGKKNTQGTKRVHRAVCKTSAVFHPR